MVKLSPSASRNTPAKDTSRVLPASRLDTSLMAEATTGAAFTVTVKVSSTVPPLPSEAVTVMVAVPRLLAVTVRLDPSDATDTVALVSSLEEAVMVRLSPSASSNTPDRDTCRDPLWLTMVVSAMALDTVGARLGVPCCCCCPADFDLLQRLGHRHPAFAPGGVGQFLGLVRRHLGQRLVRHRLAEGQERPVPAVGVALVVLPLRVVAPLVHLRDQRGVLLRHLHLEGVADHGCRRLSSGRHRDGGRADGHAPADRQLGPAGGHRYGGFGYRPRTRR